MGMHSRQLETESGLQDEETGGTRRKKEKRIDDKRRKSDSGEFWETGGECTFKTRRKGVLAERNLRTEP